MTSRDFAYWLQGLFELSEVTELNKTQTELIKKHLNMVFYHEIDPSMGDSAHQGKLSALHQGLENIILTGDDTPEDPNLPSGTTPSQNPGTSESQSIAEAIETVLPFLSNIKNEELTKYSGMIARC